MDVAGSRYSESGNFRALMHSDGTTLKTIHNVKSLKHYRRKLRRSMTPAEATLWKSLRRSELLGQKFRRQHGIGPYIVDFYCPEALLVVELDGAPHCNLVAAEFDQRRTLFLNRFDIRVIRFENRLVFENLDFVLDQIRRKLL